MQNAQATDADRATFERDGVVCLRGLFSPSWMRQLEAAAEEDMASPGPLARHVRNDGGGDFFTDVFVWQRNEKCRDFLLNSPLGEVAARILGARTVRLYNDHLLVKEPGTTAPTYWHQDLPYFRIQGRQICSFWIGLDPVRRETGAMSFVIGSHRWDKMFTPRGIATGVDVGADGFDGPVPDIDADPATYKTVCYEMVPGDCTVHHGVSVHGALGNSSPTARRRGYSVRVVGDDITWLKRKYSPTEINAPLRDGDPLSGELFPVLWPRQVAAVA